MSLALRVLTALFVAFSLAGLAHASRSRSPERAFSATRYRTCPRLYAVAPGHLLTAPRAATHRVPGILARSPRRVRQKLAALRGVDGMRASRLGPEERAAHVQACTSSALLADRKLTARRAIHRMRLPFSVQTPADSR